ncbi:glycyl-radical enzyme activating protein [Sporomusa acidovorans]|uniref:Benzylsuccinate synthase activating enzyme n=1 Tax=Sporomusa acidovorans (strain ATCC 49682 / DSM 3132 / Mol) TaxID=1123286 RepID=A0ABZ3J0W3_SPOA4|nr:glycyl-radical enzyme activating protein [Sporomusa acidovorans]OZC21328.1 benzylsuccinate synthase activating enzyme [Sporomusa acidovorans DSM 3132]SDE57246.1 pyruvate formate lyase activating enzyme [Sporomusa acidovorans]
MKTIIGKIYDIQGFSVHDGPGIRTTVFFKGCPLRCMWCHSPESQKFTAQLSWLDIRCVGVEDCGLCIKACPRGAIIPGKKIYSQTEEKDIQQIEINRAGCDDCGLCAGRCPAQALYLAGKDYTVTEVLRRVLKDRPYYEKSSGGVTISGGEPLSQFSFLLALVTALKAEHLHVCLDTSGYASWDNYAKILPFVDLVLFDVKHTDSDKALEYTGVPNEFILDNLRRMAAIGTALQIRIPVIPGFNSDMNNLHQTAELCASLGPAVKTVQLLPYHKLGLAKYQRLQIDYPMPAAVAPPPDKFMIKCRDMFANHGLHTVIH